MPVVIEKLDAIEILDSRGRPTVLARLWATGAAAPARAAVPSGASTGSAEAIELRDGDGSRHAGRGCRGAVTSVNGQIAAALVGRSFDSQQQLDETLIRLDGTPDKSRLGANAILGVSVAFARATAVTERLPLYDVFAAGAGRGAASLPRPMINLFSGGKHAGGQVEIQDVLIIPRSTGTMDQALTVTCAVYAAASKLCAQKYETRPLVADEGGLAPPFASSRHMIADAVESIRLAGFDPGRDVALAIDFASSHFYADGRYHIDGRTLSSGEMVDLVIAWVGEFPIISVEDPLAEEDWAAWSILRARLGRRAMLVGDDLLCTNPVRVRRAIDSSSADALLLKVNQVGTVSEAAEALRLARGADWRVVVSARSGETEDDWLADLAVGFGGDYIKIGSITRSERLAKYNRLLEIGHDSGFAIR